MAEQWQDLLDRWQRAGIVDLETVSRIREFQAAQPATGPRAWAVWVALAFGGIALAAGVFLFVAAHWDGMSPAARMTLVVMMVALFHGAGIWFRDSGAFRTLFHALGTLSVGAAIVLTAQIFNIEEHWATGTLLWALAAATGWLLLRDWPQGLMLAILAPVWLIGEWLKAMRPGVASEQVLLLFTILLALIYITNQVGDEALCVSLRVAGAIAVFPVFATLIAEQAHHAPEWTVLLAGGWVLAIVLPAALAFGVRVTPWWASFAMAAWVAPLVLMPDDWRLARYGWAALGWVVFVSWAVKFGSVLRVNLGVIGFALTIVVFYFSSVMDKLGRSLSLISLGILFLGGGWMLDRWRRRMISAIREGGQ